MTDAPAPMPTTTALLRALQLAPALRRGLAATVAFGAVGAASQLVVPISIQVVIDRYILGGDGVDIGAVAMLGAAAFAVLVVAALANRYAQVRMSRATASGLCELRVMTFAHLHRLSLLHVQGERRGALVARVTSDVQEIQQFLNWGGINLILGVLRVALVMTAMVIYQWELAAAVAVITTVYGVLLRWFQRMLQQAYDRVRQRVADSMAAIGEAIAGLPTVRAYGAEDRTRRRLRQRLGAQFDAEYRTHLTAAALFSTGEVFSALVQGIVLVIGLFVVDGVTAGTLVAFMFLVNQFIDPVQMLVETLDQAQVAASGMRRILRVLDVAPDLDERQHGRALPDTGLAVSVADLHFAYGDGPEVLTDVALDIPAGHNVAVVGETGSGKTTFAKVLVRLLRPDRGEVRIAGVPLDAVSADDLRRRLAFVPQEGFLFDGTLADNVRYGRPDATDAEVRQAFTDLDLGSWLATRSDELETPVGPRGGQLSAGERQLVALVRAWIAEPALLVLDEATSAVDPALDVALRRAIERLTAGRTSVTIAHRLATAENADVVVVFDAGRVVATGPHEQLLADSGVYRRLHADWTSGTSLARS